MGKVNVVIARLDDVEFSPLMVELPVDDQVLYTAMTSGRAEDEDDVILYAARMLLGIHPTEQCLHGLFAEQVVGPDGQPLPDLDPDTTLNDFIEGLRTRWERRKRAA